MRNEWRPLGLDLEVNLTFCYVKISCEKNESSICEKAHRVHQRTRFVRKFSSLPDSRIDCLRGYRLL